MQNGKTTTSHSEAANKDQVVAVIDAVTKQSLAGIERAIEQMGELKAALSARNQHVLEVISSYANDAEAGNQMVAVCVEAIEKLRATLLPAAAVLPRVSSIEMQQAQTSRWENNNPGRLQAKGLLQEYALTREQVDELRTRQRAVGSDSQGGSLGDA